MIREITALLFPYYTSSYKCRSTVSFATYNVFSWLSVFRVCVCVGNMFIRSGVYVPWNDFTFFYKEHDYQVTTQVLAFTSPFLLLSLDHFVILVGLSADGPHGGGGGPLRFAGPPPRTAQASRRQLWPIALRAALPPEAQRNFGCSLATPCV